MYEDLVRALRAADALPCSDMECPGSGECPTAGCLFREAADAIEELDTLLDGVSADNDALCETIERLKKPRWIPVTERLPEPGVPCLCWCKGGTYGQIRWYGLYYLTSHRIWAFYDNDCIDSREVTHWMHRPEPPKEDEA